MRNVSFSSLSAIKPINVLGTVQSSRRHQPYRTSLVAFFSVRRRRDNNRDGIRSPAPAQQSSDADGDVENVGDDDKARAALGRKNRSAVVEPHDFVPRAKAFLDKIHKALLPLVPINDNMIVTRGEEEPPEDDDNDLNGTVVDDESIVYGPYLLIDLGPMHGQYTLTVDALQSHILFQSPISGQRVYAVHSSSAATTSADEWCCVEDGHNLEGILVRDLIRQIQGVPNL
jgi:hypothetical protein